ncbi:MAG: hypothetical protein ABI977_24525, partial [Acidobacteriota bacterium]
VYFACNRLGHLFNFQSLVVMHRRTAGKFRFQRDAVETTASGRRSKKVRLKIAPSSTPSDCLLPVA